MIRTALRRRTCSTAQNVRLYVVVTLALCATGCRDQQSASTAASVPQYDRNEAHLIFSSLSIREGDDVVAGLEVRTVADVKPIGSYTARIVFDTSALEFAAEEPARGDAVQVLNPQPGEIRAAGISSAGFVDRRLVAVRFRARRNGSIGSASAVIVEMHATDRTDVLPRLASARVAAELDTR